MINISAKRWNVPSIPIFRTSTSVCVVLMSVVIVHVSECALHYDKHRYFLASWRFGLSDRKFISYFFLLLLLTILFSRAQFPIDEFRGESVCHARQVCGHFVTHHYSVRFATHYVFSNCCLQLISFCDFFYYYY